MASGIAHLAHHDGRRRRRRDRDCGGQVHHSEGDTFVGNRRPGVSRTRRSRVSIGVARSTRRVRRDPTGRAHPRAETHALGARARGRSRRRDSRSARVHHRVPVKRGASTAERRKPKKRGVRQLHAQQRARPRGVAGTRRGRGAGETRGAARDARARVRVRHRVVPPRLVPFTRRAGRVRAAQARARARAARARSGRNSSIAGTAGTAGTAGMATRPPETTTSWTSACAYLLLPANMTPPVYVSFHTPDDELP